jgi:type IV secretion system protein VirB5
VSVAQETSPFLAAQRVQKDVQAALATDKRNWRTAALVSMATGLFLCGICAFLATRAVVVPIPILIDSLGRTAHAGVADSMSAEERGRVNEATIRNLVLNLRTVTTDPRAQRQQVDWFSDHVAKGSSAQAFLVDYFRQKQNEPFVRGQKETVSVEVHVVHQRTDKTYDADWTETVRDLHGDVKRTERWRASFTTRTSPVQDVRIARVNPLGLYIRELTWSKVI